MEAPVLLQPIPTLTTNESAIFSPIDLKTFINTPDGSPVHFRAELADGESLPIGVICTDEGSISGFPDDGTQGNYVIVITASNEAGTIQAQFNLQIGPNPHMTAKEAPAMETQEAAPAVQTQAAPVLVKPIPNQVINEGAAFGPFNFKDFFTPESGLTFHAELKDGSALPKGMICTTDGVLTGIPAKDTQGNYEAMVTATSAAGATQASFMMTIKPSLMARDANYLDKLKSQVWEALEKRLPIPDFGEMLEQEITPLEINYLLERWGFLKIWDAFNLDPPGELTLINIEGVSKHYNVYDRGSCLVGIPKDFYSHERTIEDGMQTARAMAREVYKRGWAVELVGVDKLARAAWIEIQLLGDKHGKRLEVINFNPSTDDVKIYTSKVMGMSLKSGIE